LVFNVGSSVYVYDTVAPAPVPRVSSQFMFNSQHRGRSPYYTPYGPLSPVVKNEMPFDGAMSQALNPTLSVYIYSYQDNLMDITFRTNASTEVWHDIKSEFNVQDGTYTAITTDMDSSGTTYWWSVNTTDIGTGMWTNKTYSFTTYTSGGLWWNTDWPYRKMIIIDHTMIDDDLADFPVLISFDSDGDLAGKAQNDGDDIVFTDYSGNKLNHEIELYDNGNGHLVAWVNIPNLDSNDNTQLYMYYGNLSSGNQENHEDTWESNFVIVQHLNEQSGIHYDSTSNNNDGSPSVTIQGSASGMIDGADEFDGSNDYINCGNDNSLDITDAITIEAWVYHQSGGSSYPRINDKYPAPSIYIREASDSLAWYGQIGGSSRDFRFINVKFYSNTILVCRNNMIPLTCRKNR